MIEDTHFSSLSEALRGLAIPTDIRDTLELVTVPYYSFDTHIHTGQLVVHRELIADVEYIFSTLAAIRFPVEKVVPIVAYNWDDDRSMEDNNSSAFNYRVILGTQKLSNHSYGRAIDINPRLNPYFARDGKVYPTGAVYDTSLPGVITVESEVVRLFKERGWTWGGDWTDRKDYQHFEKV